MKANRILGLTLALDATRLGKGINDAMRSLGGFEHHAHKTARRLSSTLGKTLATELPKDIRKMRLAVRGEGIALAADQKRLDKEIFHNRIRREGIRKQMADLRHFAAERNRIYNEDVKRIRSQRKLEDDQLNHKQRALRMQVRAQELGIEKLGKNAQTHLIKGTRLQMREERTAYRVGQHQLGSRLRGVQGNVSSLFQQQQAELLSRKGAKAEALRQAQDRLLAFESSAKQTKADNIYDLQSRRKRVSDLKRSMNELSREFSERERMGLVNNDPTRLDQVRSAYERENSEYLRQVDNARTFNRDWATLKADLSEDVRLKQLDARKALGGTQFDSDLEKNIMERDALLSRLSGNRIKYKQRELEIEDRVLMDQLKNKHGIEGKEVDKLKEITRLKSEILDIDQKKFDLDSKRGRLEYRHGFTPDETMALNQLRKQSHRANKERRQLDSLKGGMYDRKVLATQNKETLRQKELQLMNEQEVAEQLQGTFDVVSQLATAALVTGFGLVFSADFFRRTFINPALQRFSEFETELTRYRSISGVNLSDPKQADAYRGDLDLIRKTSLKSGYSGTETARSLSNLISAGLDPEVSRQMLPSVLDVVQASYGEIDPEAAGKIMATIFQKFDLSKYGDIKAQSQYMADWVFQLKQASKLEFNEVGGFLSSLQAAPAILRMGTDDIGALGTVLMRLGASPRNAAQQINALSPNLARIMRKLSESVKVKGGGGKFIEEQNKLGYNLSDKDFFNADLTMKDGMSILKAIYEGYQRSKASEGQGPAEVGLYNMFQTSRGLNLMRSIEQFRYKTANGDEQMGWDALERLRAEFNAKAIGGKTSKAADEFRASPTGIAKQLENIGTTLHTAFGRQIFESVSESLLKLTLALNAFAEWVDKHPDVAGFVSKLGIAFVGLATGLGLLLVVGGGAFFLLSQIGGLLASIAGLGIGSAVIFAAPYIFGYVLILTAIAGTLGLIAGLIAIAFGSDNIIDAFNNKLEQAKMIFAGLAEMWSDYTAPEELFLKLREAGVWPLVRAVLMLKYRFEQMWDGIVEGTAMARDTLKSVASAFSDELAQWFGTGGLEFTNPETWKQIGFALGTIFSALFVGSVVFLGALLLISYAFRRIKEYLLENELVMYTVFFIASTLLVSAIITLTGLMFLLTLATIGWSLPFLVIGAAIAGITIAVVWLFDKLSDLGAMLIGVFDMVGKTIGYTLASIMAGKDIPAQIALRAKYDSDMSDIKDSISMSWNKFTGTTGTNQYDATNPAGIDPHDRVRMFDKKIEQARGTRANSVAEYLATQAGNEQSFTKNITIQKIEVVAPADVSDPDAWAKSLSSSLDNYLSLESE